VGVAAKKTGGFIYEVIDRKVVDGAVNGIGVGASETGGVLRVAQSGRVQQYALMLFGAVGLMALAIAAFNW
jgi:NADH-quinone oxidoreductase subunit L